MDLEGAKQAVDFFFYQYVDMQLDLQESHLGQRALRKRDLRLTRTGIFLLINSAVLEKEGPCPSVFFHYETKFKGTVCKI